jgi:hypothetical protein
MNLESDKRLRLLPIPIFGTQRAKAHAAGCPVLAKADVP